MNPMLLAAGTVAMRKMRKMHEMTVSSYVNFSLLIVSVGMMLVLKEQFDFFLSFSGTSWVLCWCLGLL